MWWPSVGTDDSRYPQESRSLDIIPCAIQNAEKGWAFFKGTCSWWSWGSQKKVSIRRLYGSAPYEALVPWKYGASRAGGRGGGAQCVLESI